MNVHDVEAPSIELLTLEEVRLHLRLDAYGSPPEHPDDERIESLIVAARADAENFINGPIAQWQRELRLVDFGCGDIAIPDAPLVSIDSVTYIDAGGDTQTVAAGTYEVAGTPRSPTLRPKYGVRWPTDVRDQDDAVRVRYTAGYSDDSPPTLPGPIRAAMLLTIGNLYENREAVVIGTISSELPLGVQHLLMPYRRHLGV